MHHFLLEVPANECFICYMKSTFRSRPIRLDFKWCKCCRKEHRRREKLTCRSGILKGPRGRWRPGHLFQLKIRHQSTSKMAERQRQGGEWARAGSSQVSAGPGRTRDIAPSPCPASSPSASDCIFWQLNILCDQIAFTISRQLFTENSQIWRANRPKTTNIPPPIYFNF